MKYIISITITLTAFGLFALVAFGQEDSAHSIIITENAITERSEYETGMSAEVLKSKCLQCLEEPNLIEDCWARGLCEDVTVD